MHRKKSLNCNGKWYCFFFIERLLPQREWSADVEEEKPKEKKKKRRERIPDMLDEDQICEAGGSRF